MKIKTVDVNAKEWFDKVNGNSYFSAEVIINYKLKDEIIIKLPFQYGYGDQYQYETLKEIKNKFSNMVNGGSLWSFCDNNKIILRTNKQENCLKRDL